MSVTSDPPKIACIPIRPSQRIARRPFSTYGVIRIGIVSNCRKPYRTWARGPTPRLARMGGNRSRASRRLEGIAAFAIAANSINTSASSHQRELPQGEEH